MSSGGVVLAQYVEMLIGDLLRKYLMLANFKIKDIKKLVIKTNHNEDWSGGQVLFTVIVRTFMWCTTFTTAMFAMFTTGSDVMRFIATFIENK